MEQLAIKPDFSAIPDFGSRWAAYREGPFARMCLDSICDDAVRRYRRSLAKAQGRTAASRMFAEQSALHWLEVSLAAAAAFDQLGGELSYGVEELEALLEKVAA